MSSNVPLNWGTGASGKDLCGRRWSFGRAQEEHPSRDVPLTYITEGTE